MIVNRRHVLDRSEAGDVDRLLAAVAERVGGEPLRWYVSAADAREIVIDSTEYAGELPVVPARRPLPPTGADVVVSLIPTGIGCEIGGYAGDAGPATALLAAAADVLVTNPNAVNASNFIATDERVLYTEGSCIDAFVRGEVNLYRPRANRVGLIVEKASPEAVEHVINVVNTVRAVHGVDIVDVLVTEEPIGSYCERTEAGAYVGAVERPDVLLASARKLLDRGATAIAVTTNVQDLPSEDYASHFAGKHPNPVGGAEAVISHLIVKALGVPAAHAPMMNVKGLPLDLGVVDARGAGEFVSISGLACVLIGLRNAPQILPERTASRLAAGFGVEDVVAVVAPAGALGGVPVLEAARRGIPVIAVRDNATILDVGVQALGLADVIEVGGYPEAAGVILALRKGIALDTVVRPMTSFGREARYDHAAG
ncbi:DUF3326 domain-containing protein [Catenulispora sp. NF23]|uniref:DUF3326 domain-containing protein n=1 Tax=Catenulispora pinistramenti TaxID=2705254 RepID=A0ABS5KM87_9ACTN|nr:DUF3326 domain-containing protein [Catenulispora pinistramenti]MBS2532125.1 DUF3326 domain-containing protein [Catenulispora pinistramenti]MBS2547167.1 DUF3326 domain-containing protein [Catenulispora pinistramenti]